MEKFFKVKQIVVDVEDGTLFDPLVGSMRLDFANMTMKPFNTRSRLVPIRFQNQELMFWQINRWIPFNRTFSPQIIEATKLLIEMKIEKELLG